jgi:hypothetical protein
MDQQPEVVRLRIPSESGEAREVRASSSRWGVLAFAWAEGRHLALLAENLLSGGLFSFGLVIARKWVPIRARYVGAGQHGSGPGVKPTVWRGSVRRVWIG